MYIVIYIIAILFSDLHFRILVYTLVLSEMIYMR